jgi:hypothetical protein
MMGIVEECRNDQRSSDTRRDFQGLFDATVIMLTRTVRGMPSTTLTTARVMASYRAMILEAPARNIHSPSRVVFAEVANPRTSPRALGMGSAEQNSWNLEGLQEISRPLPFVFVFVLGHGRSSHTQTRKRQVTAPVDR